MDEVVAPGRRPLRAVQALVLARAGGERQLGGAAGRGPLQPDHPLADDQQRAGRHLAPLAEPSRW